MPSYWTTLIFEHLVTLDSGVTQFATNNVLSHILVLASFDQNVFNTFMFLQISTIWVIIGQWLWLIW